MKVTRLPKLKARMTPAQLERRDKKKRLRALERKLTEGVRRDKKPWNKFSRITKG